MTSTLGIKLDEAMKQRLAALGKVKDRTPHWLMKTAISQYVEKEEARLKEYAEDEERWQQYQLTGECVSMEVVDAWMEQMIKECEAETEPSGHDQH